MQEGWPRAAGATTDQTGLVAQWNKAAASGAGITAIRPARIWQSASETASETASEINLEKEKTEKRIKIKIKNNKKKKNKISEIYYSPCVN